MRLKALGVKVLLALILVIGAGGAVAAHLRQGHLGQPFGRALTFKPQGPVRGVALVFDDRVSPHSSSARVASALAQQGMLVALLPAQRYLDHLHAGQCEMPANAAERVGRRLMRSDGLQRYFEPVLVGMGRSGSALAGLAVEHGLPQTVGGAVLVNDSGVPAGSGCQMQAPTAAQGFVLHTSPEADDAAVVAAVMTHLPRAQASFGNLPLVELPAAGSHRLVIFMSGDGGWRTLDKGVSTGLRDQGISVVGWDSLRYFWSRRTPQQAATDLAAVIDSYSRRWHTDQVELVGYSFGADAMPFLYNRLPPATRAEVRSLSLLGLGHDASFQVSVGGWLGSSSTHDMPVAPELALIPPGKLLCVYGQKEKDTLCPSLVSRSIAVAETGGGHHFDGDMPAMVRRLEANFQRNAGNSSMTTQAANPTALSQGSARRGSGPA